MATRSTAARGCARHNRNPQLCCQKSYAQRKCDVVLRRGKPIKGCRATDIPAGSSTPPPNCQAANLGQRLKLARPPAPPAPPQKSQLRDAAATVAAAEALLRRGVRLGAERQVLRRLDAELNSWQLLSKPQPKRPSPSALLAPTLKELPLMRR